MAWPAHPPSLDLRFVTYGEALLHFAPSGEHGTCRSEPPTAAPYALSVGGDELSVCAALARLGCDAAWASVLPAGPLGDIVRKFAAECGVQLKHTLISEDSCGEVGISLALPADGATSQRRHSVFCRQPRGLFDWRAILRDRSANGGLAWLHLSGIVPLLGEQPAESWKSAVEMAAAVDIPVSLDLGDWQPRLGPLAELWHTAGPLAGSIHLLVLSACSAHALADHLEVSPPAAKRTDIGEAEAKRPCTGAGADRAAGEDTSERVIPVLKALRDKLGGPAVACRLGEEAAGGQRRCWSVIVDSAGVHSTEATPTIHAPKDERGGRSAWVAGAIDALSRELKAGGRTAFARLGSFVTLGARPGEAARCGDVLAALAQETLGEHSAATREDLDAVLEHACGAAAAVDGLPVSSSVASTCVEAPRGPVQRCLSTAAARSRVNEALERMDAAKVIAILRARHEARAVERAVELADLGFRAVEVTADSVGFGEGRLLPAVVKAVGERCLVGVGTVTTVEQLDTAARGGAHFALSPVRPTAGWGAVGFVQACHERGVLAMPAAFTPQEIYECVEGCGAYTVKIFPAQLWSPAALKDLRRIGDFGKYRLCPSGGVDCSTAGAWLGAGAAAVGMGSCLVGKDVSTDPADAAGLAAAEREWREKGRPAALALARQLALAPA